jgi:hypothetical protein
VAATHRPRPRTWRPPKNGTAPRRRRQLLQLLTTRARDFLDRSTSELARLAGGAIDLILTSPPYGVTTVGDREPRAEAGASHRRRDFP